MNRKLACFGIILGALILVQTFERHVYASSLGAIENSCQITWTLKDYNISPTSHYYTFGGFLKKYFPYHDGQLILAIVKFEVRASYYPSSHEWSEKAEYRIPTLHIHSTYNPPPFIYTCPNPDINCLPLSHTRRGVSDQDPWLAGGNDMPQVTILSDSSGPEPQPCGNGTGIPCIYSQCAIPPERKAELLAQMGTCTKNFAEQPPALYPGIGVIGPPPSWHFSSPDKAVVVALVNCLPYQDPEWDPIGSSVTVEVQQKLWDNDSYGFFWWGETPEPVTLQRDTVHQKAVAIFNPKLTESGRYRVRAKSSLFVNSSERVESEYSAPWIEFTVDGPESENKKMEKGVMGEQAQFVADKRPATPLQMTKPDLTVAAFEPRTAGSGQDRTLKPRWLVQNIGTRVSPATDLLVCCKGLDTWGCPEAFGGTTSDPAWDRCRLIPVDNEFYPKPAGAPGMPGGGAWFGLESPIPAAAEGSRYKFLAAVDSTEAITELNEGNNQLSSIYPKMVVAVTAQENALIKNASPEMEPGPPVAVEQAIGSAAGPAAGISSKRIPVKGPAIRLNATSMMAPAKVKLIVQPDPDFKVKYVLEKKENGVFREIASSDRPEFQVAEPGDYQVKAQYAGGGFGKPTAFTVTPGKVTAPPVSPAPAVTAPKQPLKTPVKSKKIMP